MEQLRAKLCDRVLLLADNLLSHPEETRPYVEAASALEGFEHVVALGGKGLSIAFRSSAKTARGLDR